MPARPALALALALALLAKPGGAGVKEYCANEWPTDFEMQDFAKRSGFWRDDALDDPAVEQAMGEKNPWAIMIGKCFADWDTDAGIDYEMVTYCLKQQEKSYRAIQ